MVSGEGDSSETLAASPSLSSSVEICGGLDERWFGFFGLFSLLVVDGGAEMWDRKIRREMNMNEILQCEPLVLLLTDEKRFVFVGFGDGVRSSNKKG